MQANDTFLSNTMKRFMLPTILSVLGGTVNVMVDGIIIGNVLGSQALAAINLCMPIYLVLCTIGSLFASGACTLSGIAVGENDKLQSDKYYTVAVTSCLIISVILTIAGTIFCDTIVKAVGTPPELYVMVKDYALVTILGTLPKIMLYIPSYYIRLNGKPKVVSYALLIMMLTNATLDYVFTAIFGWGMSGAAFASVLASTVAAVFGFSGLYNIKGGTTHVKLKLNEFKQLFGRIVGYGSPAAASNFFYALRIIALNFLVLANGGSMALTIFTVTVCCMEFLLCIEQGIPQTTAPLISVCYGERDNNSIRILIKKQLFTAAIASAIVMAAFIILWRQIFALFGVDSQAVGASGFFALFCLAIAFPIDVVNNNMLWIYSNTSKIGIATTLSILYNLVAPIAAALFLNAFYKDAFWLFFPLGSLGSLVVLAVIVYRAAKVNSKLSLPFLLDTVLEREGKTISFSINNDMQSVVDASVKISEFGESNGFTPKQQMTVSLAIEEMLTLILQKCFGDDPFGRQTVDVRVYKVNDDIGIRLRNAGMQFNAVDFYEKHKNEDEFGDTLGIKLILGMAKDVSYIRTFGVNSLIIKI